jgi:hypothetical protein
MNKNSDKRLLELFKEYDTEALSEQIEARKRRVKERLNSSSEAIEAFSDHFFNACMLTAYDEEAIKKAKECVDFLRKLNKLMRAEQDEEDTRSGIRRMFD